MPKPRKKKSKIYFGTPAQDAIIEYNASDDPKKRNLIYKDRIQFPFEKLAENILNTFKFSYFDVSKEDVKKEVVSVLVQKIHMFKPDKGRAFSYFSIVAKNHLILQNNGNYKRYKKTALLSQMPETWNPENDFYHEQKGHEFDEFKELMLAYWDKNLTKVFNKKRVSLNFTLKNGIIHPAQTVKNFGSSVHYCDLQLDGIGVNDALAKKNTGLHIVGMAGTNQMEPGPISNDIIQHILSLRNLIEH